MEQVATAPPEGGVDFRKALEELGFTQGSFVRFMIRNGDDRAPPTIRRSVERMGAGTSRVSGEMRVILTMLRNGMAKAASKKVAAISPAVEKAREARGAVD